MIIRITQKSFFKIQHRFSSLPLECSNSVSLRWAQPDLKTTALDYSGDNTVNKLKTRTHKPKYWSFPTTHPQEMNTSFLQECFQCQLIRIFYISLIIIFLNHSSLKTANQSYIFQYVLLYLKIPRYKWFGNWNFQPEAGGKKFMEFLKSSIYSFT